MVRRSRSRSSRCPRADGVYDVVASTESTTFEITAKVDHTAPTITTNPAITISTVFQVGQAVTLAVNCADPGAPNSSGVASCAPTSVTLDTSSPGTRSFTATATDNAGNVRTQTFTYVVAGPYQYTNVFPYTDRLNVVRAGWNLPLIFKAFAPNGAQYHVDRVHDDGLGPADVSVNDTGPTAADRAWSATRTTCCSSIPH